MTNINMQLMLVGRVMTDGRTSARVRADLTDKLMMKANAQVSENLFVLWCTFIL